MPAHRSTVLAARKVVGGALLVFLVTWGIRARARLGPLEATHNSAAGFALLLALCVVSILVIVRVLRIRVRWRRDRDPEQALEPQRHSLTSQILALLFVVAALAIPAAVIWGLSRIGSGSSHPAPTTQAPTNTPSPSPAHRSRAVTSSIVPAWILVVVAVGLLVAMLAVLVAVVVWRRRRALPEPKSHSGPTHQGVGSPARRPTAPDERGPRWGVIAAYRAFEHEAAARGVPVEPPRTAGEIAHHQITSRLAGGDTVAALTDLFHRARYSSDPISEIDREQADRLLTRLRGEWRQSR